MSNATVRKIMIENQIKQFDDLDRKWIKAKTIEFKNLLLCGKMHRMAFDLAQVEIEIDLENKD